MITAQSANMSIADYCAAMDRNEIIVNNSYQRSDKVWPETARSYLIESVLLGFPVPKFYLHSITDPKNRRTIKEIVDGQQRSRTIHDFLNDGFSLSNSLDTAELRGLKYSTLTEEWQGRFISYNLSIDQFVGADPAEVRQVFRRMNSYTVPLNPEELRHAENQGLFKWFISRFASTYSDVLASFGVFSDKALVRMQDLKLYTEIAHALDSGISTTSRKHLDALYRKYDVVFPKEEEFRRSLRYAFEAISQMAYLRGTNLAKHYQIYSLALALAEFERENREQIEKGERKLSPRALEQTLLDLSGALDLAEDTAKKSPHWEFVAASSERTNVKDQRQKRVDAFLAAIRGAAA